MRIKERKKQLFLTMGKMYKKGFAKCTKCTIPQNKPLNAPNFNEPPPVIVSLALCVIVRYSPFS